MWMQINRKIKEKWENAEEKETVMHENRTEMVKTVTVRLPSGVLQNRSKPASHSML